MDYNKLLVAVDGSEEANLAFNKAIAIAKRNNAELNVVSVVSVPTLGINRKANHMYVDADKTETEKLLEKYKEDAKEQGMDNVNTVLKVGSPKEVLAKNLAGISGVDLVVVGATGLGAAGRFFIGSVSENVTRYAPCDVLVVRSEVGE